MARWVWKHPCHIWTSNNHNVTKLRLKFKMSTMSVSFCFLGWLLFIYGYLIGWFNSPGVSKPLFHWLIIICICSFDWLNELTWCPCGCICAKPCSGRCKTEKGLDMIDLLAGGVPGELLTAWVALLLMIAEPVKYTCNTSARLEINCFELR